MSSTLETDHCFMMMHTAAPSTTTTASTPATADDTTTCSINMSSSYSSLSSLPGQEGGSRKRVLAMLDGSLQQGLGNSDSGGEGNSSSSDACYSGASLHLGNNETRVKFHKIGHSTDSSITGSGLTVNTGISSSNSSTEDDEMSTSIMANPVDNNVDGDDGSTVEENDDDDDWENQSTSSSSWGEESDCDGSPRSGLIVSSIDRWFEEERREGRDVLTLIRQASMELGFEVEMNNDLQPEAQWRVARQVMINHLQRASRPSHRIKLHDYNTLDDAVNLIQRSSRVIVLTGAGISVSCGIPDFRSENGIYNRLGEYNLPNPQCMFDIDYFRTNPYPFFRFAKELLPGRYRPSVSHGFLALLESQGKLLRNYSQNIDGLEKQAGMTSSRLVQCHGSFDTATCISCRKGYTLADIQGEIEAQRLPKCSSCGREEGVVKPDIVFFGEPLSDHFSRTFQHDRGQADLCLVMGSSLKVGPVNKIIEWLPSHVPQILINREVVGQPNRFDIELLGDSDAIVGELCRRLKWDLPENLSCTDYGESGKEFEYEQPNRYLFVNARTGTSTDGFSDDEGSDDDEEEEEDKAWSLLASQQPFDKVEEEVTVDATTPSPSPPSFLYPHIDEDLPASATPHHEHHPHHEEEDEDDDGSWRILLQPSPE